MNFKKARPAIRDAFRKVQQKHRALKAATDMRTYAAATKAMAKPSTLKKASLHVIRR